MYTNYGPLNFAPLIVLGVALHWALKMAYGRGRMQTDNAMHLMLTIAAWLLILVGFLGPMANVSFAGVPIVLIALVVIAAVVARWRKCLIISSAA